MFHSFQPQPELKELPRQFTFPFCYTPHSLTIRATQEVQKYLLEEQQWLNELQEGKMLGVLVVQNQNKEIGFLAAFSGNLGGTNQHQFFVPPVFDMMDPEGYFKIEERKISEINNQVALLEKSSSHKQSKENLVATVKQAKQELDDFKEEIKRRKELRDSLRENGLEKDELNQLIRESQFMKAEYKRLEQSWRMRIDEQRELIQPFTSNIERLKEERKERSAKLQMWLFDHFQLLNADGEAKGLKELFINTPQHIPPAGAGECAGPKLLQYAYLHQLKPLAMAEFWWGDSPKGEIRRHGKYYPSCKGKCQPILHHMLKGLDVEKDPYLDHSTHEEIRRIYEDEWIMVIDKPTRMLSVPGKSSSRSVVSILVGEDPTLLNLFATHRLDMNTSGLLILAKTQEVHSKLQSQFQRRSVKKRYIAILEGIVSKENGVIDLPLSPNYNERPHQMVDFSHGKKAITHYEVISRTANHTRIAFYPITGRTHQLRLHAAHILGLHAPIVGDELYGHRADRLFLHAEWIEFTHPMTHKKLSLESKAPF